MPKPELIDGLVGIQDRFDGLIVDQWGVLHDGTAFYPAALEALERLRAAGKRIVLLSNSGRRLAFNRHRLARMGLPDGLVEQVVTSGEVAWSMLRARDDEPFRSLGRRCFLWTEGEDRGILDDLALTTVDAPAEADFVLLAGLPQGLRPDDLRPDLEAARARDLMMICCNPDRIVVTAFGVIPATGSVAALYEELGGRVHYVGKPHPLVYRICLGALRPIPKERILAVGDSLEHDIAGGAAAGLGTVMITSGIHAAEIDPDADEPALRAALDRLSAAHGAGPDFVLPRFIWTGPACGGRR